MDPTVSAALDALLPVAERTGNLVTDLTEAAKRSLQRRVDNSRNGGAVIAALHEETRSWADVERLTGIPAATARRWSAPPPGT